MADNDPHRLSRRRFFRGVTLGLAGCAGLLGYGYYVEPHWIEVVERDLPIANLPAGLVGKTLVQISDLHVGPIVDEDYLRGAFQRVSELKADILAITGDFMTCHLSNELANVERLLGTLQPGRLATLAILGNHDYGIAWSQVAVADALTERLTRLGVTVLRNEKKIIDGLTVVGLDDLWSPCFAPEKVLPTLQADEPALVLCHNPDAADRPIWSGYQGWILCGHTHGGQCKAPFFTPPILPINNHRYHAGAIDLGDGRWLYVNRALGYLKRVRFNVRPEITVFTLRQEET